LKRVEASAHIAVDPQVAWDLYADVPRSVQWVPFAEEILYVSGPPGLGQVYRERTRLGGISDVAEWRVVEWNPPRRQVQLSVGKKARSRLIIEVSAEDGETRVVQAAEIDSELPGPLGWLHERVFAAVARHGIREAVAAAKRELEKR
jgi:hypothetical protein